MAPNNWDTIGRFSAVKVYCPVVKASQIFPPLTKIAS